MVLPPGWSLWTKLSRWDAATRVHTCRHAPVTLPQSATPAALQAHQRVRCNRLLSSSALAP
jgi:hypothetical protein